MKVSELILSSGGWAVQRLEQIGTVDEVAVVLSISQVRGRGRDKIIWDKNKHGKYSVKSGYWCALKENHSANSGQQPSAAATAHWKHLWKLKILPKMSHFPWKCSTGYMPCMWSLLIGA